MKCFYYKWTNKKTGKTVLANFGWAENFDCIKENDETATIECTEISKDEFRKLRSKGF